MAQRYLPLMLVMVKRFITLFLFMLTCGGTLAQDPYYYVIDKSGGLPSNSVYDIFQDTKGYMWFATDDGICRYNGLKFIPYYADEQTSRAGSCISMDKYGRLWYSNFDGYLYYVENGRLKSLNNQNPRGYLKYAIDGDYLYVIRTKDIAVYNVKTLKVKYTIALDDETVSSSSEIDGKFYIVGNYLYVIDEGKMIKKMPFPQNVHGANTLPVIIQKSDDGIVFVSKNSSFQHKLSSSGRFIKVDRPSYIPLVQNVSFTTEGLWLCSTKGAFLSNSSTNLKSFFDAYNISYVFKDNMGNYWFSSVNKGLLLVPDLSNKLIKMPSRPIRICRKNDKLLVSTEDDAIYEIDCKTGAKSEYYRGKSNHAINQLYVNQLSGDVIFSSSTFNATTKNKKIIAGARMAVKEVNKVDHKYYSFAATGSVGLFKLDESITKSAWDSIYNFQESKMHGFRRSALLYNINAKSTVYNPFNKTIYYATNLGLVYVNLKTKGEIKYKGRSLYVKNLINYNDLIYALSASGKLYHITTENRVIPISLSDQDAIRGIYRISITNNLLIVYATSGIYYYNMLVKSLHKMTNSFQDFEITDVIEDGDQLVMATSKGVLLDRKISEPLATKANFVLEDVFVNNKKFVITELANLTYEQRNIEVDYALLAYAPKDRIQLYYRLNDDKWQELLQQSGALKLSSLSPGNYSLTFRVGNEIVDEKISFTIHRPIWLSNWFIGLFLIATTLMGFFFFRFKIAQNNRRNQDKLNTISLENNLNRSKLKAIKSQMNPHFFYNALNTIQSFVLAQENKQAVSYLSKFAVLTRTILEMSEKDEVLLTEEIKTIGLYLDIEKARFDSDFNYSIKKIGIGETDDIKIPSMLLQPYLENAVKHGLLHKEGQKELKVIFEMAKNELLVTIEDNGIGRKRSMELNEIKQQKHKSFATAAIQSRIELLNLNKKNKIAICYQDKVDANQQPAGTLVLIQLPLNED